MAMTEVNGRGRGIDVVGAIRISQEERADGMYLHVLCKRSEQKVEWREKRLILQPPGLS